MPRPTKRQLQEREAQNAKQERYARQEAKRATRVQIDTNNTLYLLIGLTIVMFATSAVLVANGTIQVAAYIGLAFDWMAWMVFGAVEVAILVFLGMYLIIGSRSPEDGDGPKAALPWFGLMIAFSFITIAANAFHTVEFWQYDWSEPRLWVGTALSVVVPLSYVLAAKGLSRVVFARAVRP